MTSDYRLLLIEDSRAMQTLIKVVLRKLGEVVCAGSGTHGIECFRRLGPFDAILLDIELPDMDGFEVAEDIRSIPGGKDIPVVVITSQTNVSTQPKASMIQNSVFFSKKALRNDDIQEDLRRLIEEYRNRSKSKLK